MSRSFIAFMLAAFIVVGALFFFTLYQGSEFPNQNAQAPQNAGAPALPPPPPAPGVSLMVQTSTKSDFIVIAWANLPEGTIALDVFRTLKKKISWELWHEIPITTSTRGGGSTTFALGKKEVVLRYSFYVQAVSGADHHAAGGGTNAKGQGILWTSSVLDAAPQSQNGQGGGSGGGGAGGGANNGTGGTANGTSSAPSTGNGTSTSTNNPAGGNNANNSTSSGQSGGGNAPAPSGTPYYTPEIKISGYGQPPGGSFWVQHIDQKIQIGWQGLPPPMTRIEVARAASGTGPWSTILIQENPDLVGPYSLQLVDDTLGQPYYYELNGYAGSSTIGTYGPVYLQPVGQ